MKISYNIKVYKHIMNIINDKNEMIWNNFMNFKMLSFAKCSYDYLMIRKNIQYINVAHI